MVLTALRLPPPLGPANAGGPVMSGSDEFHHHLFVAPAGAGDDRAAASVDGRTALTPIASLPAALARLRELRRRRPAPAVVHFQPGVHRLSAPLRLGPGVLETLAVGLLLLWWMSL